MKEFGHNPIFIVGFMACGKTTFGRALAKASGRQFFDLDFFIEQRFHATISEIFRTKGEEGFRKIEAAMLREIGDFDDVVIACGGGTPCFHDNMAYMNSRGLTVWLTASVDRMVERLIINSSRRPLMAQKSPAQIREAVVSGLEARNQYYSQADMEFSGENLEDRSQIDETVKSFLLQIDE